MATQGTHERARKDDRVSAPNEDAGTATPTPTDSPSRRFIAGTAAIGGLYQQVSDEQAAGLLHAAWDAGIREFDTAPHYGLGESERRLGTFLAGVPRDQVQVETKVGRIMVPDDSADDGVDGYHGRTGLRRVRDYSAEGVGRSLDDSLRRLGLARVDVALVHDPEEHMADALTAAARELGRRRADGTIRAWGVGTNFVHVAREFVRRTDLDRILLAGRYSLLDRRAEPLLTAAADAGVEVLIGGVLNGGLLAGAAAGLPMFDYAPAAEPLREAAARMERACVEHGVSLRAAALQFAGRHPAVRATVLGARSAAELTDTFEQLHTPIPDELWPILDACVPDQRLLPD